MWLISTNSYQLEEFLDSSVAPPYAILSHTWGNNEPTFKSVCEAGGDQQARQNTKIRYTCEQAKNHGLSHAWIDTICIDKDSSAGLTEAINSMYRYYEEAQYCYAFLTDVDGGGLRLHDTGRAREEFKKAKWFTRGWTLQELIAPTEVLFYDRNWGALGVRSALFGLISEITTIDHQVLRDPRAYLRSCSIAKRMSWAAGRKTTRTEDEAYSLLGIFEVSMPMVYGEGRNAFIRLQEEILRRSTDLSIFAWTYDDSLPPEECQLLARSPKAFRSCAHITSRAEKTDSYQLTNAGLDGRLPIRGGQVALMCYDERKPTKWMALSVKWGDTVIKLPNDLKDVVWSYVPDRIRLEPADSDPILTGQVASLERRTSVFSVDSVSKFSKRRVTIRRASPARWIDRLYGRFQVGPWDEVEDGLIPNQ